MLTPFADVKMHLEKNIEKEWDDLLDPVTAPAFWRPSLDPNTGETGSFAVVPGESDHRASVLGSPGLFVPEVEDEDPEPKSTGSKVKRDIKRQVQAQILHLARAARDVHFGGCGDCGHC